MGVIRSVITYAGGVGLAEHSRNTCRADDGTLFCLFEYFDGGIWDVYIAYSTDYYGITWAYEQVPTATPGIGYWAGSIAIDSSNTIHIVWVGQTPANPLVNNIHYITRTIAGVWGAEELITDVAVDQNISRPSISIDSGDNINVVWPGRGWAPKVGTYSIQYRQKVDGVWQAQEAVSVAAFGQDSYAFLAIDISDDIHVVWRETNDTILYRAKIGGAWQAVETIVSVAPWQRTPTIAIGTDDTIHVAWTGQGWGVNVGNWNIQYCYKTGGVWQPQEGVTDDADDYYWPSIGLTLDDQVYLSWVNGLGAGPVQVSTRVADVWQTPTDVDTPADYNSMMWGLFPISGTDRPNILDNESIITYCKPTFVRMYIPYVLPSVTTLEATGVL